jgi:hypothetical protein
MNKIPFNKASNGMAEIREHIGGISANIPFVNVSPDIVRSVSFVSKFVGIKVYEEAVTHYHSEDYTKDDFKELNELVWFIQEAMAHKGISEYQAEGGVIFDATGIHIQKSNDKQATAFDWLQDNLYSKYIRSAYKAIEDLITCLNTYRDKITSWKDSDFEKKSKALFIRSASEFDGSLFIDESQRLYLSLLSIMRRIESREIKDVLKDRFDKLKAESELNEDEKNLRLMACDAIAHIAMSKAIIQFPIEIMPDGVVEKFKSFFSSLNATKEARQSVTEKAHAYYINEGNRILKEISDFIFNLDKTEEEVLPQSRLSRSRNSIAF